MIKEELEIVEFSNEYQLQYAIYDNYRSISSYIDGLKPSSRKLLYCSNNFKNYSKVDTIANYTASETQYLHGTVNLEGVLKNLCNDYTGTNIISYFDKDGFFGTRVEPTAGASRYIKCKRSAVNDLLFRKEDSIILENLHFEGYEVEPKYLLPILPMILVNGSEGIGNGFSQTIYSRNIREIAKNIFNWLDNVEYKEMKPYFERFKGNINSTENSKRFEISGNVDKINSTTIIINEIPINSSVDKVLSFLRSLSESNQIKSFKDMSNKNDIKIEVKVPRSFFDSAKDLLKFFKLKSSISENITVIGEDNQLLTFNDIEELFTSYCSLRLEKYNERKRKTVELIESELSILENKKRFISDVINEEIRVLGRQKTSIEQELSTKSYDKKDNSYDYLLNINFLQMTREETQKFEKIYNEKRNSLHEYKLKDAKDIWKEEINELLKYLKIRKISYNEKKTENKTVETSDTVVINIADLF